MKNAYEVWTYGACQLTNLILGDAGVWEEPHLNPAYYMYLPTIIAKKISLAILLGKLQRVLDKYIYVPIATNLRS